MIASVIRVLERTRPYLSFRPFEVTTAEGRASERQRRAALSSLIALLAKFVAIATQLITIPLTLNYLGPERFGMWATMSSVISMLAFADLGIGNGLLNAISEANGNDDSASMRQYISSAAFILSGVTVLLLIAFAVSYQIVPWGSFFNVKTPLAMAEAGPAAAAFVLCFALNIPTTIVQRVQLGLQMGFVANLWQAIGSFMALSAVLVVVHLKGGLHWLVLSFAGTPVIAAGLNGAWFFMRSRTDLLPRFSQTTRDGSSRIIRTGLLFLVLQIVVSTAYLSDNIIISQLLGASAVTSYAVPEKLFSIIPMLLMMVLVPLWPAYTEAIARKDNNWVRTMLKKTLLLAAVTSTVLSLILFLFGTDILRLWTGTAVLPSLSLLLGFALWKVIEALGSTVAVYLNGNNLIKEQIAMSALTSIAAVTLKLLLVYRFGVTGAIWATIISYLIFTAPAAYFLVVRSLHRHIT